MNKGDEGGERDNSLFFSLLKPDSFVRFAPDSTDVMAPPSDLCTFSMYGYLQHVYLCKYHVVQRMKAKRLAGFRIFFGSQLNKVN